ncbi:MAG: FecR domain-containing protein [Gammaproteobacteria bacterium]
MNSSNWLAACGAAAMLATAGAQAQEAAGRVLIAVGDVAIERNGQRTPARNGMEVRSGDQFQLGAQSNAQIRLNDESILALRPETTFKLTEFAFAAGDQTKQRALFELIRGGVRTVTGVIGRINRDQYKVVTPTSTIGIRGTHYSLVQCESNCRNRDGSIAPSGTYGGVTDGRIGVTNQSGESVFGADQYFHVPSPTAAAQQLIAPPGFLRDTLEGRARAAQEKPKPAAPGQAQPSGGESAQTVAQTGLGATTGDTSISSSTSSSAPLVLPETTQLNAFLTNETQTTSGVPLSVQSGFTGTQFYRLAGSMNLPVTCTDGSCAPITQGDITIAVNYGLQRVYVRVAALDADGVINIGTPFNADGAPITISNGAVSFNVTYNRSDFPTQQGAFRCSTCGAGGTVGFANSITFSGTISGSTATLTLGLTDVDGSGYATGTLTQVTPSTTDAAAIVTPRLGGGADARSETYSGVTLDGSRRLTNFGPLVGQVRANVGSATNTISGSNAEAGNLVWGMWQGAGAQVTDFNYASITTTAGAIIPWITGTVTDTLPAALGSSVSYSPVGGLVNGGNGTLNSASLTADFVNRTVGLNINATNTGAGNTFQMNGSSGVSAVSGRFSGGFSSVTCTGPCSAGTPTGSFGGFFSGAQAEGAGVGFTAGYGTGNGVSGVAAFKR